MWNAWRSHRSPGRTSSSSAPSLRHQRISMRLTLLLHRLLVETGHGELFFAPVGVEFPTTQEGVQPDLVFVSKGRGGILADPWTFGADPGFERFTGAMTVRLSGEDVGEMDLAGIFEAG